MIKNKQPTWISIREEIQTKILNRDYQPGDKLPKDDELAVIYGCARTTIQRAMRHLADKGLIERRRKGGTHVKALPVTRATFEIPITRLEVEEKGSVYGYQLVQQELVEPTLTVQASFGLKAVVGKMLHVKALHLADQRPYIYEDRWICTQTAPEITQVDLQHESANEWLVKHKPYNRCDLRIYAKKASEQDSVILGTSIGDALLVIERTTWIDGQPITTVKAVTRPDYHLLAQIK